MKASLPSFATAGRNPRRRVRAVDALLAIAALGLLAVLALQARGRWPLLPLKNAAHEKSSSQHVAPVPLSAPVAAESFTPSELFALAADRVENLPSLVVRVRQQNDLYGQRQTASGAYVQGPPGSYQWRLETKTVVAGKVSLLEQVCDGAALWTHTRLGDEQTLSRVDVRQVLSTVNAAPAMPAGWPGIGGLGRWLRELALDWQFDRAVRVQLRGQNAWKLDGSWRPERLARHLPGFSPGDNKGEALSQLPDQLPDRAVIYLKRDDLFPLRADFRRKTAGDFGHVAARDEEGYFLCGIEWHDPQTHRALEPLVFQYQPGSLAFTDETPRYLAELQPPAPATSENVPISP